MENKKIRLVDGFKIRNTLDTDFIIHEHSSNLCWYAPRFYIPENEIWVDHKLKDEINLIKKVFDIEHEMVNAKTFSEVRQRAKEELSLTGKIPPFSVKATTKGTLKINYINGEIVRQYIDPYFIFGGHHYVYDYIPENEIWIDAKHDPEEYGYILCHEEVERDLMIKGKNYDTAHDYAIASEKDVRRRNGAAYPGDSNYPWFNLSNEEILKKYFISSENQAVNAQFSQRV